MSSQSVGGDCVATRGRNPRMLSEPTFAMMFEVEGYATLTSLFLHPVHCQVRLRCLQGRALSRKDSQEASATSFRQEPKCERRKGSQVPKQDPGMFELYCDLHYLLACHDDSQSCRRSSRGECKNKAETHVWGSNTRQTSCHICCE